MEFHTGLPRSKLYRHQEKWVDIIKQKKFFGLFTEMSTGKTITLLTAISDLKLKKVIVIAPLSVCTTVWCKEYKKWAHTKDLLVQNCTGKKKDREQAFSKKANIYVINFDNVKWMCDNKLINGCDMLVIDESSMIKSASSKRFRALRSWRNKENTLSHAVLLSGTPCTESLLDLWPQIFILDKGKRLFRIKTQFVNTYFYKTHEYGKFLTHHADTILSKIKDISLTAKTIDFIQLPEVSNIFRKIILKDTSEYEQLEEHYFLDNVTVDNKLSLFSKLMQICNGCIYDLEKNYKIIHNKKIKELKQILSDNPSENFLLAYLFKSDVSEIKKFIPNSVQLTQHNNKSTIEEWNKGNIKLLLANPKSCGYGLNLQQGGSNIIWFGVPWSLELYLQFNARIVRKGQKNNVKIIHIVCEGLIDDLKVMKNLKIKFKAHERMMDFLDEK